ncbi:MAG: hypothetical protein CO030_04925 [Candidatus Magasanikbacteria bacterium CG_4_9_14_0_2_um_filter_42_11]|uniref:Uncharacterized protein n=1 Tax=Candidatus Magasanikbacteria bacterium CG_4_9_14_0_2_um_filter_42_11 TaxID=1974643 RepID=A0A2M8F8G9_9BACT|nr:MAG: hypothetical protein COY70_00515 [Candidatus Magasanikbacteria bacterium CG_4_10_14_0_8_um_filter_42_12]PJC52035.1 MAG: hypothetical protein CO030_04925 [Candidatus Magasanikbacteria bacterium CG_4_9_14_0_2_um_filter_42_11]
MRVEGRGDTGHEAYHFAFGIIASALGGGDGRSWGNPQLDPNGAKWKRWYKSYSPQVPYSTVDLKERCTVQHKTEEYITKKRFCQGLCCAKRKKCLI